MNYVQIPEETAKIIRQFIIEHEKCAASDGKARAIIAVSVLSDAIAKAAPLPKKPGPKGKQQDPLDSIEELLNWNERDKS